MTLKKIFAPLSAVVVVAMMAVSLLGQVRHAEAANAVTVFTLVAPVQAAGLTETYAVSITMTETVAAEGDLAGGDKFVITFPANFVLPAAPTAVATGAGYAVAAACTMTAATVGQVVTVTLAAADADCVVDTSLNGVANITLAGIQNPTTAANLALTAGTILIDRAGTDSATTNLTSVLSIWNTTATKTPTTNVSADGASTVQVTFTSSANANSGAAGTANQVLTVTTDVGTLPTTVTGTLLQAATVITTPVTATTAGAAANSGGNAATLVAIVKAPATAGASTVILRATPSTGGQAVIVGSAQITWIAATTQGAVAAGSVTPAGSTVINSTGGTSTQVLTYTFVDASGNAPIPGATIVCSATLGTLTAPTNGTGTGTQQTTGTIPVGGVFAVTLNGSGLGGTSTVTCAVGAVSVAKTVTISGLGSTMTLTTVRSNGTTGLVAKGNIRGTDSTTDQDELIVVAVVKDANGNVVGSGNVQFTLSTPAGSTVVLANSAGAETLTATAGTHVGTSCSVSGTGTLICVDAIEAGVGGGTLVPAASAYIDVDSAAAFPEPSGTYTITGRFTNSDNTIVTATATFTVGLPVATITFGVIPTIPVGGTASLPFTVADSAGGVPVAGSLVTITVSNLSLLVQTATGATGQAGDVRTSATGTGSITLIGVAAGTSTVVANLGTVTAIANVTVGVVAPPVTPLPAGTGFSGGTIAPAGVSIVSFTGTTAQLGTAGTTAKVVSATATVGGKMITYVVGAPDFVNAEFNAAFPTGLSATLMIVKTGA